MTRLLLRANVQIVWVEQETWNEAGRLVTVAAEDLPELLGKITDLFNKHEISSYAATEPIRFIKQRRRIFDAR